MSRSNPTADKAPSPVTRWFEWDGSNGEIRYYDRDLVVKGQEKKGGNVVVGKDFAFLLLDETATIRGWHEDSESGIYSNEVRDTTAEPFVVKAFAAKHEIARGFYSAIKDRVKVAGGNFTANLYIGYRPSKDEPMEIGSLQLKGAALNAWVEFRKANRSELYSKAVRIVDAKHGKKGKIEFYTPVFKLIATTQESDEQAKELDGMVQAYLKVYFAKRSDDQAASHAPDDEPASSGNGNGHGRSSEPDDDEIPF